MALLAGSVRDRAVSATTTTTATGSTTSSSTTIGSISTTTTTTSIPVATTLPTRSHYTILEIGDSLGTDLGGGLGLQLEKSHRVTLIQKGKSVTGLSNAWYFSWPQHLKTYLAQYHPQLLIVFLGGNDEQGMNVMGHAAAFNTTPWRTQYAKIVRTMMDEATKAGSAVLWVGMPVMYPNGYRQGMQVINSIFEKVAATVPHVTFLPTWKFMANAKGEFRFSAWVNGKVQALRTADGIHPTSVGQNVMATYVIKEMHLLYGLPVTAAYPMQFSR